MLVCGLLYLDSTNDPPREKKLIASFYEHRTAYERLRDMIQADKQVLGVTPSGVETTVSGGLRSVPPTGSFPSDRYNQYLALLRGAGAKGVFRREEHSQDVNIAVWGSGFGGDTRHLQITWLEHEPTNLVGNLDDYYKTANLEIPPSGTSKGTGISGRIGSSVRMTTSDELSFPENHMEERNLVHNPARCH